MSNLTYLPISRRRLLQMAGVTAASSSILSINACSSDKAFSKLPLFLVIKNEILQFIMPRSEMGQDIATSFAMLIAEELEAPLESINIIYANASVGIGNRMTVGSSSIKTWWKTMRTVGATTKQLLLEEASRQEHIPVHDLHAEHGHIKTYDDSIKIPYQALIKGINVAATVTTPPLKTRKDFRLLGHSAHSTNNLAKVTGAFEYHDDSYAGEEVFKVVSVCFKESWTRPSEIELTKIEHKYSLTAAFGIEEQIGAFTYRVFLVHNSTWSLLRAKQELESIRLANIPARSESKFEKLIQTSTPLSTISKQKIDLYFSTSPLAHAALEPPSASIAVSEAHYEIWAPTQAPNLARKAIAKRLDIAEENVILHTLVMGGSFGRKRYSDYLEELAIAARELNERGFHKKLKLIWTREDELSREFYRPATLQHAFWEAAKREQIALNVLEGHNFDATHKPSPKSVQTDLPLSLNVSATKQNIQHHYKSGIWRAVHHGYHAFALCSMVDEICWQTEVDPLDFYLDNIHLPTLKERAKSLLNGEEFVHERLSKVISKVRDEANWNKSYPEAGYGFSAYSVFGSHIAVIVKLVIDENKPKIERIWACVDCGFVINPDKLRAQIEGGLIYGLSAALHGQVPDNKDRQPQNFHSMPVLRINESPEIKINLLENDNAPTGAGELGVPVIAPAVCNALRGLTGLRFVKLPIIHNETRKLDFTAAVRPSSNMRPE